MDPVPATLDRFVGRDAELTALRGALAAGERLLTLVGPGGIGKTRLVMELAARLEEGAYPGGVFVCALGEVGDEEGLYATLADALGVDSPTRATTARGLGRALKARGRALVVLDEVERIVDAAASAASAWLTLAPDVQLVVTSRERLRVRGEHVFDVGPLAVPVTSEDVERSPAVQLLAERARAQRPDWQLRPADVDAVFRLSVALEGIPLAIELAAARLSMLEPGELVARMRERLDVLSRGGRDARAGGSTLRNAIDGSFRLLSPREQAVFVRCSVFRGGFGVDAAELVLATDGVDVLDAVQSLRDKSLLRSSSAAGKARLDMFESIRAFAEEKLGHGEAKRALVARHRDYYLALARRGSSVDLEPEHGNLAALVDHALEGASPTRDDVDAALEALLPLEARARGRALHESYDALLARALDLGVQLAADASLLARGLDARARRRQRAGELEAAQHDFDRALSHARAAGRSELEAAALLGLGVLHHELRELDRAQSLYEQALSLSRAAKDAVGEGRAIGNIGAALHDRGDFEGARANYVDALARLSKTGQTRLEGITLSNLGILDQEEGEFDAARSRFERAQELLRASGDRRLEAICVGDRASLHQEMGELTEARRLHERSLAVLREFGDVRGEGLCLARLGAVLAASGELGAAARALSEAEESFTPGDATSLGVVGLNRAFLALARGDAAGARARVAAALARGPRGEPPLVERSDDARRSVRTLTRLLRGSPGSPAADTSPELTVTPDGASYRPPDGEWQDLSNRRAARLLLGALLARHRGEPLTSEELWSAAWPGEKTIGDAWLNRLHVALSYLRRNGLRAHIVRRGGRYALDPLLTVTVARAG
jgi:predicted ATPase/Tfp pilus assembly protein PilF